MKITVVIPMAGAGSRFQKEGWSVPKPLIEFNGKMMIEHVLDSFALCNKDINFVLIVRSFFVDQYKDQLSKLTAYRNVHLITAEELTQGAACTVLLAREFYKNSSLLVADSDTFYTRDVIAQFLNFIDKNSPDIALVTFNSQADCYSYVSINENDHTLISIAEKEVISSHAISGVYYFKYGFQFIDACINLLIYNKKTKNEFYMSSVVGEVAKRFCSKCMLYNVDINDIYCTGTPTQLKNVQQRLSYRVGSK